MARMSAATAAPTPLKMAKTGLMWLLCPFVVSGMVDGGGDAGGSGPTGLVGAGDALVGGAVVATATGRASAPGRDHAAPPAASTSRRKRVTRRPAVALATPSV
jgi:hypothetical protein